MAITSHHSSDLRLNAEPSVLRLAAPLVVSFWMRALFTFVDTIFAATLGDASVAAIGLSIPFEFLMIAVWVGLSTGLTSNLARAMGASQGARIEQHLGVSWRLVLFIVPLFLGLGALCWPLASRIAPGPDVARQFAIYGSVLIGGSALSMFWSVIPDSVVKAHGDTRSTMWAGIWSNVINLVLNVIFTFVFHWGIFGIALSTVIGRFGGLAYALRKASGHETARKARGQDTVPGLDPFPYRASLALALPAALAYCLIAAEGSIINGILRSADHATQAIAAYAIFYRVFQFMMMPAIAISVAMLPFSARRFGAGDFSGIAGGVRQAHLAAIAWTVISAPVLYFGAAPLAAALTSATVTREFATFALRLIPMATLASLPLFLVRPAFEGMGRGRPGLVMAIVRYAFLTAPAAWVGIHAAGSLGLPGFYGMLLGLIAASGIASGLFLLWIRSSLRAQRVVASHTPAFLAAVGCLAFAATAFPAAGSGLPDDPAASRASAPASPELSSIARAAASQPPGSSPRVIEPLDEPAAVAVGPDGSIYICESLGSRVSVFDRSGALLRRWGNLGSAEGALDDPRGIDVAHDGTVYVADTGNHRIEVFTAEGRFERAWGRFGSDAGEFNEPLGLRVLGDRVYVADSRNNRVQIFERSGRFISYIWNYGFLEGAFDRPVDVAADDAGNIYVSDQGNARIQKFARDGRFLRAWGGKGRQGRLLAEPGGVDYRDGRLLITDAGTDRVLAFNADGEFLDEWTLGPREDAPGLGSPVDVAAFPSGNLLAVCSAVENRCQIVDAPALLAPAAAGANPPPRRIASDGYKAVSAGDLLVLASRETGASLLLDLARNPPAIVGSWGTPGREPLEFVRPSGSALDLRRGAVIVSDTGNLRLQLILLGRRHEDTGRLDPAKRRFVRSIFLADQEGLDVYPAGWNLQPAALEPGAIARDPKGRLFIIDTLYRRVVVMDDRFRLVGAWGGFGDKDGQFRQPVDLALDAAGKLVYVLDKGRRRVQAFDPNGRLRFAWGGPGTGPGLFTAPAGIATGNDGSVYVLDRGANRLQKFDRRGKPLGAWGRKGSDQGAFFKPESVSVDGKGRVIVIDSGNRRAEAFSPLGEFLWEMPLDPAAIAAGRARTE